VIVAADVPPEAWPNAPLARGVRRLLLLLTPGVCMAVTACARSTEPQDAIGALNAAAAALQAPSRAFMQVVSDEIMDGDLDPDRMRTSAAFPALLEASQQVLPAFEIAPADHEDLATFALSLGFSSIAPGSWQIGLHLDQGRGSEDFASFRLPAEDRDTPPFYARIEEGKRGEWRLASWPPKTREALDPVHHPRILLNAWDAGQVPGHQQNRILKEFGLRIAADKAWQQAEWKSQLIYHSLLLTPDATDPWSKFEEVARDAIQPPVPVADPEPFLILSSPAVPASLLLGALEVLARPGIRWAAVWVGTPGEILDDYQPLDQRLAWEPRTQDLVLAAGATDAEWNAALKDAAAHDAAVGLRLAPQDPVSLAVSDFARLRSRGIARIFLALPGDMR
jgi:hypothetical protein